MLYDGWSPFTFELKTLMLYTNFVFRMLEIRLFALFLPNRELLGLPDSLDLVDPQGKTYVT